MSERKITIAGCCIAFVAGVCFLWVWRTILPPSVEKETDVVIEDLSRQIKELEEQSKQKVVVVREQVKDEVSAQPPDGIADGLNNELASFRRSRICPQGICDD